MGDENVGLTGALYAHVDTVTNEAANEVAEFKGGWDAVYDPTIADWYGQSRIRKAATLVKLDIRLIIPEVAFKPGSLEKLYGATKDDTDVYLKDAAGTTAATSYTFDSTTVPPELQWLVECQLGGKTFQAFAGDGIALGTTIPFDNENYVAHNLELMLYSATGTLIAFLLENGA